MRKSIEGTIYNSEAKLPINNVSVGFIDGYKAASVGENIYLSDNEGSFKIESIKERLSYTPNRYDKPPYPLYIKIEKRGFVSDTIFIGDTIYRKDEKTIFLDTIYLKPVKSL